MSTTEFANIKHARLNSGAPEPELVIECCGVKIEGVFDGAEVVIDSRPWCYITPDNDEAAFGPFTTAQEAVEAAQERRMEQFELTGSMGSEYCEVGRLDYITADKGVDGLNFEEFEEKLEECVTDRGLVWWEVDDSIFDSRPGAKEALKAYLRQWFAPNAWAVDSSTLTRVPLEDPEVQS